MVSEPEWETVAVDRLAEQRLLAKHKYPPDKQPEAIRLVIEQMEAMAPRFAG